MAATGYRPGLDGLSGQLGVLDDRGWPRWAPDPGDGTHAGLYTLGFGDPSRGNLRGLRLDARRVARKVKDHLDR